MGWEVLVCELGLEWAPYTDTYPCAGIHLHCICCSCTIGNGRDAYASHLLFMHSLAVAGSSCISAYALHMLFMHLGSGRMHMLRICCSCTPLTVASRSCMHMLYVCYSCTPCQWPPAPLAAGAPAQLVHSMHVLAICMWAAGIA